MALQLLSENGEVSVTRRESASSAFEETLEVHPVTNAWVDRVYSGLSPVYDFAFGRVLQGGRRAAVERMSRKIGTRVLEVGVGTGLSTPLYPRGYRVWGIDLCSRMLAKARRRIAREGLSQIRLYEMDAASLAFADGSFDIVYAPYLMSVVPDPVAVAREMQRVCRRGGMILMLNHFQSESPLAASVERFISRLTVHIGFRTDLDLSRLLVAARLTPLSIDKVNVPPIWSLVACINE